MKEAKTLDVHADRVAFKTYLKDVQNGIEFSTVEMGNTITRQNMEQEVKKIEIHVWTESSDEPQLIISVPEAKFPAHSGMLKDTEKFDRDKRQGDKNQKFTLRALKFLGFK